MEAREQLEKLLRIQELALEIRAAQKTVEASPGRLEEIQARFRERNAEFVAVKDRHDELEADQSNRSGELTTLEAQRDKYMEDLMQVKNQREYAAMLKEVDAVKVEISGHEEAIIKDLEELEKVREELKTHEQHIAEEMEIVKREGAAVEEETQTARDKIESLERERTEIGAKLPPALLVTVGQLEATRQGVFLSKAEHATCQSCFVRVRPQVFQEIKLATKVHRCDNCRRFLYHEPSLKPKPADESARGETGPTNLEAINGGAV